ncbi:MAG: hypothetical protein Q4D91_15000 [Lautropia sp.]|nr:hypothetical protein [Lautropia sp.]
MTGVDDDTRKPYPRHPGWMIDCAAICIQLLVFLRNIRLWKSLGIDDRRRMRGFGAAGGAQGLKNSNLSTGLCQQD